MDAAQAFVVTTPERAKDLKQTPVTILAAAQGIVGGTEEKSRFYGASLTDLGEIRHTGRQLFDMSGLKQKDIGVAQLDDSYGPLVPMQLEALGFCGRGEGASYVEGGERIGIGGELALNTSGGSLGEGHIFGLNHIAEAVRLTRGTSSGTNRKSRARAGDDRCRRARERTYFGNKSMNIQYDPEHPDAKATEAAWETVGFWEGVQRHELVFQKCGDCGMWVTSPDGLLPVLSVVE